MKRYLVFGILLLSLVSSVLIYLSYKKEEQPESQVMGEATSPEIESLVKFTKHEVSAFVFNIQEDENSHRLYVNLTPFVSIDVGELKIGEFRVNNFQGSCAIGDVVLIHPTDLETDTIGRNFLFQKSSLGMTKGDIKSEGNSIEYVVVDEVARYNEVNRSNIVTPYFGIIVKEIGNVDYKAIKERDGVFDGTRYLEYAEISQSSLNTDFQFDIFIKFEGGEKYIKTVKGSMSGQLFKDETAPLFELTII